MISYRIIVRLDIKGQNLIKGVQMEGLRVLGKPAEFAKRYADEGADELFFFDTVASLYGRNQLEGLLSDALENTFIPITVAGGIRTLHDVEYSLRIGADRVAINTAGLRTPNLISRIVERWGGQALTVSIEAKRVNGGWEAYTDCGRERTGKDAIRWAHEAAELGAGELLITSVDRDGTRKGFDAELLSYIDVDIPVIVSGGFGRVQHLSSILDKTQGVAIGTALHYGECTIGEIKDALRPLKEIR